MLIFSGRLRLKKTNSNQMFGQGLELKEELEISLYKV